MLRVFVPLALCVIVALTFTNQVIARSPVNDDGRVVEFERDIVPILRNRCLECHNEQDAKNDFRVDDPDYFLSYVEPEDPEGSIVYADFMITEDEDMMMPPTSHGGPLSAAELALIRLWITEGAEWPEGVAVQVQEEGEAEKAAEKEQEDLAEAPLSLGARLWAFQGYFHPAVVHFPIALLIMGAAFVVLGWFVPILGRDVPFACLVIGAAFSVLSCMMGWSLAIEQGWGDFTKGQDSEIFWHRWSGVIVATTAVSIALFAIYDKRRPQRDLSSVWRVGLLIIAAMVGLVGHQGGELTYGSDFYARAFQRLRGTSAAEAIETVDVAATEDEEKETLTSVASDDA